MLSKRLNALRNYSQRRSFKVFRKEIKFDFLSEFKKKNLLLVKRSSYLLKALTEAEIPIILPDEKIAFMRTIENVPAFFDRKIGRAHV